MKCFFFAFINYYENLPFNIPLSWQFEYLKNLCEYIHRGKSPQYGDVSSVPIIAQKCNQWNGINLTKCLFAKESFIAKYSTEHYIQLKDIIINSTGTGTVGRTGFVTNDLFLNYKNIVVDSHVTIVRCSRLIYSDYIYCFLISPHIQSNIEDICTGSTNQIELNTSTICNYIVPLPPIKEQIRIVTKINQLLQIIAQIS